MSKWLPSLSNVCVKSQHYFTYFCDERKHRSVTVKLQKRGSFLKAVRSSPLIWTDPLIGVFAYWLTIFLQFSLVRNKYLCGMSLSCNKTTEVTILFTNLYHGGKSLFACMHIKFSCSSNCLTFNHRFFDNHKRNSFMVNVTMTKTDSAFQTERGLYWENIGY